MELTAEDALGRTSCSFKRGWSSVGDYRESYHTNDLASGAYRLVLRSGGRALHAMVQIMR
jgi:hypothetical protein